MKILIVEDDENIVRVISDNLTKWGYDVLAVENFNDVMETFNNFKPQLVLLDIVLPFFNGYYWSSEIRKISTVPIIFISSKAEDGDIVMGMQFGGDDYITKVWWRHTRREVRQCQPGPRIQGLRYHIGYLCTPAGAARGLWDPAWAHL